VHDEERLARLSRNGEYKIFTRADGLEGSEVRSIAEDPSGTIWVGTAAGHVLRFEGDRFVAYPLAGNPSLGSINGLYFARPNSLWLATAQGGIALVSAQRTRMIDTSRGLPDNNVTQVVADDRGFLWCGSNTGIFRVACAELEQCADNDGATVNPLVLGREEGLKNASCTAIYFPGVLKAADGKIWFATRQGVLAVDPAAEALNERPRRVRIEGILADDRPIMLESVISLPARVKKLQFQFSVLFLAAGHRAQAAYRLDGFDTDWVAVGKTNVATFPRLSPGRYTFRVRADGDSSKGLEDRLTIEVVPLWWQSKIALASAALLTAGAVAFVARTWANRRLRRQLRELERERAVERERARIARNIHDDVGASLTHISLLTQAAVVDNTPEKMQRIFEATREITRSLDEIVWAVNPQNDTLESFAEYLTSQAQRFLQATNLRCRLDIPNQLPGLLLTSQVRHHLFLCCREAINNVIKHAHASEVSVQLNYTEPVLSIVIADDGIGFDVAKQAGGRTSTSGNGLRNLRQRMDALGGTCETGPGVQGRGTTVKFQVHLN
jgi:signal transduction histidine kinase